MFLSLKIKSKTLFVKILTNFTKIDKIFGKSFSFGKNVNKNIAI